MNQRSPVVLGPPLMGGCCGVDYHTHKTPMISEQQTMHWTIELADILIGTWNVHSINRAGIMMTIVLCFKRYKLDITIIEEVKWDLSGNLKTHEITIFNSSEEKLERGVDIVRNAFSPKLWNFNR